jgi:hypothetical protein
MSEAQCKPGDNTGFPVTLAQSLYREWPATNDAQRQIQTLTVPTDFSIQWLNNGIQANASISVRYTTSSGGVPGVFQISGFNPEGSTITFGNAQYKCSGIISIVQNQHPTFCQDNSAQYEMILAFQITNKSINPSSPDIILLCRPISFQSSGSNPPNSFWNAVDTATFRNAPQRASIDLSTFFGYNASMLMPIVTYQTCMPVKLLKAGSASYGSLRIRVNVVTQPIRVFASENGLGKCSSIRKYTLVTTGNGPVDIFASGHNLIQFKDGTGADAFPNQNTKSNLVPNPAPNSISALSDVLQKFEILVPEAFLGKSLAEIANAPRPQGPKRKNRPFKCYTIDPRKDIVDGQIMVDPTTGQSVNDTQKQDALDAAGGDISMVSGGVNADPGIMPGDVENVLTTTITFFGTVALLSYLGFIAYIFLHADAAYPLNTKIFHVVMFIISFVMLMLFLAYDEKADN